jgi:hypothetical protein
MSLDLAVVDSYTHLQVERAASLEAAEKLAAQMFAVVIQVLE